MANNYGEGFILTNKLCMNPNEADPLGTKMGNQESNSYMDIEGVDVNKQEKKTTKQVVMWQIQTNGLHTKFINPVEDRMCSTVKHLHYIIRGVIEVFADFSM